MSTPYGPREATWGDVHAAHLANWDAVEQFGLDSPQSLQAFDLAEATQDAYIRAEARQAVRYDPEAGQ